MTQVRIVKKIVRSERYSSFLLVGAAALGLVLANTAAGPALEAVRDAHLEIPLLGLDLTVGHWVTDGLLAVFFFLAAIELRHELTHGELNSPRKALVPSVAAVGGVIVPAAIFLLIAREPGISDGWPIPTATDIAFALGVLALVGRGLPSRVRAFLLALAVIDDLIAILIIAFFFTENVQPLPLLVAVPVILTFGWLSRSRHRMPRPPMIVLLVLLGIAAWILVYLSGVHATVAGVALGLAMGHASGGAARHALEPWSNGVILPVFAFVAALVTLPAVGIGQLSPAFWAIIVALPVGKLIGITGGAMIGRSLSPKRGRIPMGDVLVVATLGGIGFTVSLLMNELAYANNREVAAEGTIAVIIGSVFSAIAGIVVTVIRSRHYSRERA